MAASSHQYRSPEGQFAGHLREAIAASDRCGIDFDDLLVMIASNPAALNGAVEGAYANFIFNLTVDHDIPSRDAINDCGFDDVWQAIWRAIDKGSIPSEGSGKERIKLKIYPAEFYAQVQPRRLALCQTESDFIIATQKERGEKPAGLRAILALAKKHPRLQLYFSINALGSIIDVSEGKSRDDLCAGRYILSIRRPSVAPNIAANYRNSSWERCLSLRPLEYSWLAKSETYGSKECFAAILP